MADDKTKDQEIAELKAQIEAKDRQVSELLMADAPADERELTKDERALVAEGCKAYGIAEQYVLKARIEEGAKGEKVAVIITHGGTKVRYFKGMKDITPLEAYQVDGIIRKKMKPVKGTGKKS